MRFCRSLGRKTPRLTGRKASLCYDGAAQWEPDRKADMDAKLTALAKAYARTVYDEEIMLTSALASLPAPLQSEMAPEDLSEL